MTDFMELVKEMRSAQKEYFRTRDANVLNRSKDLEKKVDRAIDNAEEEEKGGTLF